MISIKRLSILLVLFLAGCASHRPPDCKGPYTPIQSSSQEASHGA